MEPELKEKYLLCGSTTPVAINRNGEEFRVGDEVVMRDFPVLYKKMIGELLEILEIYVSDNCESGFMLHVIHKETKNKFKSLLDTNWFKKLHHK